MWKGCPVWVQIQGNTFEESVPIAQSEPCRDPSPAHAVSWIFFLRDLFSRRALCLLPKRKTREIISYEIGQRDKQFSECWNKQYMRKEGKRPRGIRGKMCNALFKPKQTSPDRPAEALEAASGGNGGSHKPPFSGTHPGLEKPWKC